MNRLRLIFCCLLTLLFASGSLAQLKGEYNVGSSSVDYPSLDSALKHLDQVGVSGSVIFNMISKEDSIGRTVDSFPGMDSTIYITIRTSPSRKTPTVLYNVINGYPQEFINFKNCPNVRINRIHFKAKPFRLGSRAPYLYSLKGSVIQISASINYFELDSCDFDFQGLYDYPAGIIDSASATGRVFIRNNRFRGLSAAVGFNGCQSLNFHNNEIEDFNVGVSLLTLDSVSITDNNIYQTQERSYSSKGLRVVRVSKDLVIARNRLYCTHKGDDMVGIDLVHCDFTKTNRGLVINNMVSQPANLVTHKNFTGIAIDDCSYLLVANNTVATSTFGNNKFGMTVDETFLGSAHPPKRYNSIYNNILQANTQNSSAALKFMNSVSAIAAVDSLNYNVFSAGTKPIMVRVFSYDLSTWSTARGWDQNSMDHKVVNLVHENLHVKDRFINSKGKALSDVNDDYDQESRGSPPDPGADEFLLPARDLIVLGVKYPTSRCSKNFKYELQIENYGSDTLKNFQIAVERSLNGEAFTQYDTVSISTTLAPYDTAWFDVKQYSFDYASSYQFRFKTILPNGLVDQYPNDNEILSTTLITGLADSYYPGKSGDRFSSLNEMLTYANTHGVCAEVVVNMIDTLYKGAYSLGNIKGTSTYPMVFQPDSSLQQKVWFVRDSLEAISHNYLFELRETPQAVFRNLNFKSKNGTYGTNIMLYQTETVRFENCNFHGHIRNKGGASMLINVLDCQSTKFDSCNFLYGSHGINARGNVNAPGNIRVNNCAFSDYFYHAISGITLSDVVVEKSTFSGVPKRTYGGALNFTGLYGLCFIRNNTIIEDVNYLLDGIVEIQVTPNSSGIDVSNNLIQNISSLSSASHLCLFDRVPSLTFNHNTLKSKSNLCLYLGTSSNFTVLNNIFYNSAQSNCIEVGDSSAIAKLNYNTFYSKKADYIQLGTKQLSLKQWQSSSIFDQNSMFGDPAFKKDSAFFPSSSRMNNTATFIASNAIDLANTKRDSMNPDPGAYEFSPSGNELTLDAVFDPINSPCARDSYQFKVVVSNAGVSEQTDFKIYFGQDLDTNTARAILYRDTLKSNQSDTISLKKFIIKNKGVYQFFAWIDGKNSGLKLNDTAQTVHRLYSKRIAVPEGLEKYACKGDFVKVSHFNPDGTTRWYRNQSDTVPLKSDSLFSFGRLQRDSSVWLELLTKFPTSAGLKQPSSLVTSTSFSTGKGLSFRVLKTSSIDSLTLYPTGSGSIRLIVWDSTSQNTVYTSNWFSLKGSGASTPVQVGVEMALKPGSYIIGAEVFGITGLESALYSKSNYPVLSNDKSIEFTASHSDFATQVNSWHWFFDWKINALECVSDRKEFRVEVGQKPIISLLDTHYCDGAAISQVLSGPSGTAYSYRWNTGDSSQTIMVSDTGYFHLNVSSDTGCTNGASMQVKYVPQPTLNLGPDTSYCSHSGIHLVLKPGLTGAYHWNGNSTADSFIVSSANSFSVHFQDSNGCKASDTLNVWRLQSPKPYLGNDTAFCPETSFLMDLQPGIFQNYLWNDSSTDSSLKINLPGQYWVEVQDSTGCKVRDSIWVKDFITNRVRLGPDSAVCKQSNNLDVVLDAGSIYTTYEWSGGESTQQSTARDTGLYWVTAIDDNGCKSSDTIRISFLNKDITLDLGPDRLFCEEDQINFGLNAGSLFKQFLWSDGTKQQAVSIKDTGTYWLVATDAFLCQLSDTVHVVHYDPPDFQIFPDVLYNPALPINDTLKTNKTFKSYYWQNGDTESYHVVKDTGWYWVEITDSNDCYGIDSVHIQFWDTSTGIDRVYNQIRIFPIPAKDQIHIHSNYGKVQTVSLLNIHGRFIKVLTEVEPTIFELGPVTSGLYMIEVLCGNQSFIRKIIVE